MTDIKTDENGFRFDAIGKIHSCFKEKFGIPRQPGLVSEAVATLELYKPYARMEAVKDLEAFTHVWIVFVFHDSMDQGWKPKVRPPRLGGNRRIGVFATRSGFRPNPIGLSPVKLEGITEKNGKIFLHLKGVDLLDGTPVLDIKPYLSFSDKIEDARSGYAEERFEPDMDVSFTDSAMKTCIALGETGYPKLKEFIIQMLENDPRPGYCARSGEERAFANRVFDFDLRWKSRGKQIIVTEILPVSEGGPQ